MGRQTYANTQETMSMASISMRCSLTYMASNDNSQ